MGVAAGDGVIEAKTQGPQRTALVPTVILLAAFAVVLARLTRESMWGDEVWSLWAVRDGWGPLWARLAGDVHPPLYFLLLRGWTLAVGETPFAARYFSAGAGIVALAFTYALGRHLFDRATALIALIWLGSGGLWLYYTSETRMYTLVIALATLAMWCFWQWLQRPQTPTTIFALVLANSALLYTHYAGAFLVATELAFLLLAARRRLRSFGWVLLLTVLLYLPWLPIFFQQSANHPNGLTHATVTVDWSAVTWLTQELTSGVGLLLAIPYLCGDWRTLFAVEQRDRLGLLLLWLLGAPLLMVALTAWGVGIFEARYVSGVLPALALLAAYGIRHVKRRTVLLLFLIFCVSANLTAWQWVRPPKPPWETTIRTVLALRQPQEPTLLALIEPQGPERYYDRLLHIQNEATLDLAPLRYQPDALRRAVDQVADVPTVWVMMPSNIAASWQVVALLGQTHGVTYRAAVDYMIFYRFTRGHRRSLRFRFGDQLHFVDPLFASTSPLIPGGHYCRQLHLQVITDLPPEYSLGLHLVDSANRLVAQRDQGIDATPQGTMLVPTLCLDLAEDLGPGSYDLRLVFYRWTDGVRLPVYEEGAAWGDALILDLFEVK